MIPTLVSLKPQGKGMYTNGRSVLLAQGLFFDIILPPCRALTARMHLFCTLSVVIPNGMVFNIRC